MKKRLSGSETKGEVEKIEKHSNNLKERYYYLNYSMLDYAKTLGGEPYLCYSRKTLHNMEVYRIIKNNVEVSRTLKNNIDQGKKESHGTHTKKLSMVI